MDFLNWIVENWFLVIALIAIVVFVINDFVTTPKNREEQIAKLQEWLLFAVAEAEKALGGGTGQLKLRYVYDMFLDKFPALSKVITFTAFSALVDRALVKFNNLLTFNKKVEEYVTPSPTVVVIEPSEMIPEVISAEEGKTNE